MTLLSLITFSKEFIIINDSLVIISVMILLLSLVIKNTRKILTDAFDTIRNTQIQNLGLVIRDILKFSIAYRQKLETVIELNLNRDKLLPNLNINYDQNESILEKKINNT